MTEAIVNIICVLIGGVISLCGSLLAQSYQFKKESKRWAADKKLQIFADLIALLDSINMQIIPEIDINLSNIELKIDAGHLKQQLEEIGEYIDNNRGMLFIFLPNRENRALIQLRGKIYSIISNEEKQRINSIIDHELMLVIKEAKEIADRLKKDIYKE